MPRMSRTPALAACFALAVSAGPAAQAADSCSAYPTGTPREFRADCVATAKRDLAPGDVLDGEGGFLSWGKAIPVTRSLALGALPIGFAHGARVIRPVKRDTIISFADVVIAGDDDVLALRREMERSAAA